MDSDAIRHAKDIAFKYGRGEATAQQVLEAFGAAGLSTVVTTTVPAPAAEIDVTALTDLEQCAKQIETAKTPFLKSDREGIAEKIRGAIAKLSD